MNVPADYNRLTDAAYRALSIVGGNPLRLEEPFQTVVLVDTAKGIIDNGGIKYFFESDFPFKPDYSAFSAAFRKIGLVEAANDIDRAVAEFPFADPHLHAAKRRKFLCSVERNPSSQFLSAGDRVMEDQEFDSRVVAYANGFAPSAG